MKYLSFIRASEQQREAQPPAARREVASAPETTKGKGAEPCE
jgi:hypothetical protein